MHPAGLGIEEHGHKKSCPSIWMISSCVPPAHAGGTQGTDAEGNVNAIQEGDDLSAVAHGVHTEGAVVHAVGDVFLAGLQEKLDVEAILYLRLT